MSTLEVANHTSIQEKDQPVCIVRTSLVVEVHAAELVFDAWDAAGDSQCVDFRSIGDGADIGMEEGGALTGCAPQDEPLRLAPWIVLLARHTFSPESPPCAPTSALKCRTSLT